MKICMISSLYPPLSFGGATGVAQMEAEYLAKMDHDVFVITTNPNPNNCKVEVINGVKIYRMPSYNLYSFYENFRDPNTHRTYSKFLWHLIDTFNLKLKNMIMKVIDKEKPDIVHVHNFGGLSKLLFSGIKCRGIPLVFTAHDCSVLCPRANLVRSTDKICKERPLPCSIYSKINKYLLENNVDVVLSPSQFLIDKFRENGIFKETEMIKLPNPIDLKGASPISKSYDNLELLYVGELSKHKGLHILIKAFEKVNDENICLHIYGRGSNERYFKRMAKKSKNIIFHGYAKGFEELREAYKKANVTILPSICYDNSPIVLYESFMNSTPVIASRIGGIPELVIDNYNGFLFEASNVNELSMLIVKILEDPASLNDLERGAYESCKQYKIEVILEKLVNIYREKIDLVDV